MRCEIPKHARKEMDRWRIPLSGWARDSGGHSAGKRTRQLVDLLGTVDIDEEAIAAAQEADACRPR